MQMAVRIESWSADMDIVDEQSHVYGREQSFAPAKLPAMAAIERKVANDWPSNAHESIAPFDGLPARMRLVIKAAGSMAAIARRCGFSEGAVRSWRDGQSDISRERCVVLARTFGISLIWLMTGEGPMRLPVEPPVRSELTTSTPNEVSNGSSPTPAATPVRALDARLLAAASRLLQSYIGLLGGSLNPDERADALAELYEILGTPDAPGHTSRLIAFHAALNTQLRKTRPLT